MVAKKKGAGGSLTRSQVVTVRLDPKLKFAAELAAKKQRRTISSFIEWAVEQAIERVEITAGDMSNRGETIIDALARTWDVEEPDRIVKLAVYYPQLLSYEEEQIWKLISECAHFWVGGVKPKAGNPDDLISGLYFDRVRARWETLNDVITGDYPNILDEWKPVDSPLHTEESIKNKSL
jgi:predicted transcriptional regulator